VDGGMCGGCGCGCCWGTRAKDGRTDKHTAAVGTQTGTQAVQTTHTTHTPRQTGRQRTVHVTFISGSSPDSARCFLPLAALFVPSSLSSCSSSSFPSHDAQVLTASHQERPPAHPPLPCRMLALTFTRRPLQPLQELCARHLHPVCCRHIHPPAHARTLGDQGKGLFKVPSGPHHKPDAKDRERRRWIPRRIPQSQGTASFSCELFQNRRSICSSLTTQSF